MNKKNLNKNVLFTVVLLAAAALLYLLTRPKTTGNPCVAVLQYGNPQQTQEISLDRDADYDFVSAGYTIHLRVENGGISFVDSPCADHTCEGFGVLKNAGDWAACLPALASLTLEEKTA